MKTSQGEINTQSAIPKNTQEDCAFDGAMTALVPITDAAHLIHGPSGCINNSWRSHSSLPSSSRLYKIRFTTDMDESDIIFGSAKKLYKAILELERRYKPAAVFVYSTCVSALIGDDINGTCKAASEHIGIPVIPVDSPGFVGNKNLGIRIAGEALLEHVIGTAEPDKTTPYDINLIGEYNIAGMILNVIPLLEKLDIRVIAKITGDTSYKEVCQAHRAKLNVMINSKAFLKIAKKMKERFAIPYVEESFYGVEDMNRCLRNIALNLGDTALQERTEKLIAEETTAFNEKLATYRLQLQGKRILLHNTDLHRLIISVAKKLGMEVIPVTTKKMSQEDQTRIRTLLNQDWILLEQDTPRKILQIIEENQADILIANSHHQYTAIRAKIPFLDINQELYHSYAGYAGILQVTQQLYASLYSPVWEQVRKTGPWEV